MKSDSQEFSILIVDDSPTNIDILRLYLDEDNYMISAVTSGEKALEIAPKILPDLILLDIMMPGIDGYQTCQSLKAIEETKAIPIIFVTAKTTPEDLRLGFSVGAVDYITKPVNQDIVRARVKHQLLQVKQTKLERQLLNKASKMAELGSMVGSITHEVSSPLGNLRLSIDFMKDETDKLSDCIAKNKLTKHHLVDYIDQMKESLALCQTNNVRANELMNSFKKVAVDQCSNQQHEFNLKRYVEDTLLTLKPKLKKYPHDVHVEIESTINMDSYPGALSQILINLVNNTLMHGFPKDNKGEMKISASATDETVSLVFADNGVGMDNEQLNKAFNKFYTTKKADGGSGLGLAICKELVERELAGKIAISSEQGKGTIVTMKLKRFLSQN